VYDVSPLTMSMLVDGMPVPATYDKDNYSLSFKASLGEGGHAVKVTAYDAAGNESTVEWRFSVYLRAEEDVPEVKAPVEKRFFVETSKLKYGPGNSYYATASSGHMTLPKLFSSPF